MEVSGWMALMGSGMGDKSFIPLTLLDASILTNNLELSNSTGTVAHFYTRALIVGGGSLAELRLHLTNDIHDLQRLRVRVSG